MGEKPIVICGKCFAIVEIECIDEGRGGHEVVTTIKPSGGGAHFVNPPPTAPMGGATSSDAEKSLSSSGGIGGDGGLRVPAQPGIGSIPDKPDTSVPAPNPPEGKLCQRLNPIDNSGCERPEDHPIHDPLVAGSHVYDPNPPETPDGVQHCCGTCGMLDLCTKLTDRDREVLEWSCPEVEPSEECWKATKVPLTPGMLEKKMAGPHQDELEIMEFLIHQYANGDVRKMTEGAVALKNTITKTLNGLGWFKSPAAASGGERCERCGWPLVADPKDGCVRGNCSMRPMPPLPAPEVPEGMDPKTKAILEELSLRTQGWKPSRGWDSCEGCTEVDDRDCLDEPCGRLRVEAEQRITMLEKAAMGYKENAIWLKKRLDEAEGRMKEHYEQIEKDQAWLWNRIHDREAKLAAAEEADRLTRMDDVWDGQERLIAELEKKLAGKHEYIQRLLNDWNKVMCAMARKAAHIGELDALVASLRKEHQELMREFMTRHDQSLNAHVGRIRELEEKLAETHRDLGMLVGRQAKRVAELEEKAFDYARDEKLWREEAMRLRERGAQFKGLEADRDRLIIERQKAYTAAGIVTGEMRPERIAARIAELEHDLTLSEDVNVQLEARVDNYGKDIIKVCGQRDRLIEDNKKLTDEVGLRVAAFRDVQALFMKAVKERDDALAELTASRAPAAPPAGDPSIPMCLLCHQNMVRANIDDADGQKFTTSDGLVWKCPTGCRIQPPAVPIKGPDPFDEFLAAMRAKFNKALTKDDKRSKTPWATYELSWLMERLEDEWGEWQETISLRDGRPTEGDPEELLDIANFCMFVRKRIISGGKL